MLLAILLVIFILAILIVPIFALDWIITCGIVKLICLCFGLKFTWLVATGVWLVLILLQGIFE